ncbi:Cytochrome b ascorbate-dependent protein 3, partial [Aptenodytes forsteri]
RRHHPVAEMLDLPFLPFCVLLGGLGFVCVAFVSAWCQHWRGGFALDGSAQTFNWHPVLMVTGMVVLYGAAFLLPWAPAWLRALYKPVHVFFGSTILMLSVASCVSGINEKLFFSLKNGTTEYKCLPAEAVFANTLGLLILLFGVLVLGALARPSWKRPDADSPDSCQ